MSKLLSNLLLGAAAGIMAGAVVSKALERQKAGKPVLPSALIASVGGLLPLGKYYAQRVVDNIDAMLQANSEEEDGGDHLPADQDEATAPAMSASTSESADADLFQNSQASTPELALVDLGHPAGPGFVPTPE